jgi:hypothetical protein
MLQLFLTLRNTKTVIKIIILEARRIYIVPDVGTADEDEWYEVLDQTEQVHVPHEQAHV